MHFLPDNVLFNILKYIENSTYFIIYLKQNNKPKYLEIIKSLDNKINNEYKLLNTIDNIYQNIETINKKIEYMNYKRKLFDFNYIPINLSIIAYKVLELGSISLKSIN